MKKKMVALAITAACDHTAWVDSGLTPFYKWFFPTGYSKYGHCD